jgi:hypothetical protein
MRCRNVCRRAPQAPPGGFLAALEGYVLPRTAPQVQASDFTHSVVKNSSAAPERLASQIAPPMTPSIVQLRLVWAVPNNSANGLRVVAPRTAPLVPRPACDAARALVPAVLPPGMNTSGGNTENGWRGAECGATNAYGWACPSHM